MAPATSAAAATHNRDQGLQKYMLLYLHHQELREHLDEVRPTADGRVPYVQTCQLLSQRPPRFAASSSSASSAAATPAEERRGGPGLVELSSYIHDHERRLFDVNESMKRTLTELLNSDDARSNPDLRLWIQSRLMETERELRLERRRKSSAAGLFHP